MKLRLGLAGLCLAGAAHANGRAPLTNGVFFQANDPHALYVRTTFGLLVSHDDGCSFRWTCEQSVGYGGMYDPTYAVANDGTLFATTFDGLRVSHDGGCSFTTATEQLPPGDPGRIAGINVDALALAANGDVWVATAESGQSNNVYRSTDNATSFQPRNMSSTTVWWNSLAVAQTDPMRVYLTGYQAAPAAPAAHLFVTINAGQAWTELALTGLMFAATPVIKVALVDPANPQRLFVTSIGANGVMGDRLYRSTNGGTSFSEVLATTQPILDVVLDGASTVIATTGPGGSFRSDNAGASFTPIANAPQLACLGARPDGSLIGCAANWDPDFMAVAQSSDASQWQKLFRFIELDGPLACAPGTPTHDVCDQQLWAGIRSQFGATGPTCPSATDLPMDPVDGAPQTKPGGCCDAGDGPPLGAALLALLTVWALRRR